VTDLPAIEELRERIAAVLYEKAQKHPDQPQTWEAQEAICTTPEGRIVGWASAIRAVFLDKADAVLDAVVRPLLEENERLRGEVEVLSRQVDALEFEASVNEWIGEDEGDDD
jgi:hypothetical protein